MPDRPLLTLTLIAKNEAHHVRRLLDNTWDHVDQVVVVDTGSTDGTVTEFKNYAAAHKAPRGKLKIARFAWCDDFAAARQAADNLATGQWLIWADMDDEIRGLDQLRSYVENASDDVIAFFARYAYARDDHQNPISELWRERVVRNDGTPWTGRLHEHKLFTRGGAIVKVDPGTAEWIHHRDHNQRTGERNLRILEAWLAEEPENPRVVQSLAMELMGEERHAEASAMFGRYLELPGEPTDRRAQATRQMCVMLLMQGRAGEARAAALGSLQETWLWADTHLTLAECDQTIGRPDQAIVHAETAMRIGKPDTLLIVNPLQYTAHPQALIALCLAQMGRIDEAVKTCEEVLQIAPSYPLAVSQMPRLRAQLRKHHAVGAFTAMCESLVETGELLKAERLLSCAPWYVTDDERIIRRRGELAGLISERQASPKVAEADEAADAFIERQHEVAA